VEQGEFLEYFDKIRARTRRVAALIPGDRVEWSLKPGASRVRWQVPDTCRC
jgi:hypothetical protein